MNYSTLLEKIIAGNSLEEPEASEVMCQILAGQLSGEKIAAFLTALRCKGEDYQEVVGFVKAMRSFAVKIDTGYDVVDTCGTGGDGAHTFNISTTTAFIAAGAGVPIAKHGNRCVSSQCGSADVLEQLGVKIDMTPERVKEAVEKIGIGFCFAPLYHQSMKYAAPVRKELGIRTVFNMLGPLLNPFLAKRQVIGVFAPHLTEFFAKILQQLGSEHVFIIYGEDGLDEFTLCGKTRITEMTNGTITTSLVEPEEFGFSCTNPGELKGGDKKINAQILTAILQGEKGPRRDVAILNAALAIRCAGKSQSIPEGIRLAQESIDSGAALHKLTELIQFSARN
jgi:anthranilate phosphoribosyltransferase